MSTPDRERYVAELRTLVSTRAYPGDSASVFRDAIKINDVAAASKARGGRDGAGYSLAERFAFLRDLVDSDVGEIYYVNGEGGYDTHSNQVKRTGETSRDLDTLLANVSTETAKFFSSVKDNHDITVIIFSEFGRTIRVNGDRGTDHGEGGGMFMLTSNPDIRASLPRTTYGYGSATKSSENWLGVGIDYRSVYGVIYRALYGLDPSSFFGHSVSIDRDVSLASARIGRVETRYEPLSTTRARVRLSADVAGDNLDLDKAGYVQYGTATDTGAISMQSPYATRTRAMSGSLISFTRDINVGQSMAYRVDAVTNQYVTSTLSGSVAAPRIVATPASRATGTGATPGPAIDASGDSILYAHRNTAVNGEVTLAGSGITLYDSGSGATTRTFTGRGGVEWSTGTGFTGVSALFGTGLTWQGGFTLGEGYTGTGFFGTGSLSAGSLAIPASAVSRVAKIGADTPGVGLRLTQSVRVTLSGSPSTSYRVYRSEDGRSWEDITGSGAVIADQAGRVSFGTDRFSYFAIVPATPVCTLSASESTVAAGASVSLSYLAANASTAQIAPYVGMIAPLAASGSVSVIVPSGTTEYVMTLDSNSVYSCRVSVTGTGGSGGGGGGSGGGTGGGGGSSPSTPDSSASSGGGSSGGSGGLPSSDAGYRQRTSANATTVVGRPRAVRSDSASGVTMRPADSADMEASAEIGAPVGLSDEDARTAEDILARALGIADMPESSLSRMRLRQDLVERVERSIARTVASGPDSERATRLLRIVVALDRIAAELPSGSNLERTVRSVRSRTLEKFPEAAETAGPMADSIRDSADSSPLLPDSSLRMPPAVVPAESRRTGRVVRR